MNSFPVIYRTASGEDKSGTGFFLLAAGQLWISTAAHVALDLHRPHKRWSEWPPEVRIGMRTGIVPLQLFRGTNPLLPTFAHWDEGETIGDIMLLPIGTLARPLLALSDYKIHSADAGLNASANDPVTAYGFPRIGDIIDFSNEEEISARLVAAPASGQARFSKPAVAGMSGGPLLGAEGIL